MRYGDWDVLLFPQDSGVPFREFKVACHMVHDSEFSRNDLSIGLPTLCCFVPSLQFGSPFHISLHSWSTPFISQFTSSYAKQGDDVMFEARVFIDGNVMSSTTFGATGEWPHIIKYSSDTSKNASLEPLRFPEFNPQLLQQNFWSAADDLGRVKLIISEFIPRNSSKTVFERTKNVVAFSFQHAPLEILEVRSIAWPSSMMWCHTPFMASTSAPSYPPLTADSHTHSPRREKLNQASKTSRNCILPDDADIMSTNEKEKDTGTFNTHDSLATLQECAPDPFVDTNAYFEWMNAVKFGHVNPAMIDGYPVKGGKERHDRRSSTDTSMPDYVSNSGYPMSCNVDTVNFRDDGQHYKTELKVPANTPVSGKLVQYDEDGTQISGIPFPILPQGIPMSFDFANTLTNSLLLNQPLPTNSPFQVSQRSGNEIKSRKEGHRDAAPGEEKSRGKSEQQGREDIRKISQQFDTPLGSISVSGTFHSSRHVTPSKSQEVADIQRLASAASQSIEREAKRLRSVGSAPADILATPSKTAGVDQRHD